MGVPLEKLPAWPIAMTRLEALAYTRVSEAQMREWQKRGAVRFCARGTNGALLVQRSELDVAVADLFATSVAEDLDFG